MPDPIYNLLKKGFKAGVKTFFPGIPLTGNVGEGFEVVPEYGTHDLDLELDYYLGVGKLF